MKSAIPINIKSFLRHIKYALEPLGYQFARVLFFLIPRFTPKIDDKSSGLNFIGFAKGELGLGQAMRSMAYAVKAAAIPFVIRRFNVRLASRQSNSDLDSFSSNDCRYPINIICVNPDMLNRLPLWVKYSEWAKTYNIGYWFWELENFPSSWKYATHMVDEIWVATEYIAQAMRKSGKKVVKIPFPLEFELPPESMNKEYFGINPNKFTFLFSFDFLSAIERKNPQGVIMAFRQAFPSWDDSVHLILKTMNSSSNPASLKLLEEMIDGDPRIELRGDYLSQNEIRGLIRSADCYISLHRAEGLGLGLAEAMYMGRPTIATAYSGNLEFMNDANSMLVPFDMIPIPRGSYPHGIGSLWAQPNIKIAAKYMKELARNNDVSIKLGWKGMEYLRKFHSYEIVGKKIRMQLKKEEVHI
jgi:glycosyltransferase involved in cell wall biosynthesis